MIDSAEICSDSLFIGMQGSNHAWRDRNRSLAKSMGWGFPFGIPQEVDAARIIIVQVILVLVTGMQHETERRK